VHAVAGIGHPEAFFATLREAGMIVTAHAWPDHAAIVAADLEFDDTAPVLMTGKDAVKCSGYENPRLWAVDADAVLSAADAATLLSIVETRLALSSHW
jgi:tetraacyldisaccharide 4'-kinase